MSKIRNMTVIAALLLAAASAHAQTVTFTDINDAVPGKFFDSASSVPDATDPNTLVIGLNTGLDPTILKNRDFEASLLAYFYPSATDTISFVIDAPDGYTVDTVTYDEALVLGTSRTGRAFAATQLVVNGVATEAKFTDLSGLGATHVPMSITTSLVAANVNAQVTGGRVVVQVKEAPRVVPEEPGVVPETPGVVPETPGVVPEVPLAQPSAGASCSADAGAAPHSVDQILERAGRLLASVERKVQRLSRQRRLSTNCQRRIDQVLSRRMSVSDLVP